MPGGKQHLYLHYTNPIDSLVRSYKPCYIVIKLKSRIGRPGFFNANDRSRVVVHLRQSLKDFLKIITSAYYFIIERFNLSISAVVISVFWLVEFSNTHHILYSNKITFVIYKSR